MAPKAKTAAKKTLKTASKPAAKKPVKAAAKTSVKAPVAAKRSPAKKVAPKEVELKKSIPVTLSVNKAAGPKPVNESVFGRLLREKRERHEHHMKQNAQGHHSGEQKMPHNHASFSKFAGPRRRAS